MSTTNRRRERFILGRCKCGRSIDIINENKSYLKTFCHGHNRIGVKYDSILKNTGKLRISWNGYYIIKLDGRYERLHRLIYECYYDCCLLPWIDVDHINKDKLDNRIENLRPLTKSKHNSLHKTKDLSNRICLICNSRKTSIHKKTGHKEWFRYNDGFICRICYRKQSLLKKKGK